ncbi:neural cell adhesion molecule 1-like isoform 3-T3 [Fundulus diaphanus]
MIRGLTAFSFLSTLVVIQTLKDPDNIPLTEAGLGQTVTLNCNAAGFDTGLFYWYKMNYGFMVQTVAMGTFSNVKLEQHFPDSRFKVNNTGNMHYLTISNVSKEDEATYLCQAGSPYKMVFINGTNLSVNDSHKKSYYVKQTSGMKFVSLGTEVTLQCSLLSEKREKESTGQCAEEHKVFWFRAESESNPGFIYADKKRCSTQEGGSCEYRLSKIIQSPSDTGTYYCAVITCGEILFGEGTKVETSMYLGQEVCLFGVVLGGLLACSVLVNFAQIFSWRKGKQLNENKIAAAELHKIPGQKSEKRNEDKRMYSAVIFTMIKTDNTEQQESAAKRMMFAAVNPLTF